MVSNKPVKIGRAVPWSYSSLTAYEQCPKRFYLTRISKQVSEPQTAATMHGNEVHAALEKHVAGTRALPEKYSQYLPIAEKMRLSPGRKFLEYKFGITAELTPCELFAPNVWARGVLDVGIVHPEFAVLADYKTGKRKPDSDQLKMFAMAGMSLWPFVKKIKTAYIWLQTGQMDAETYTPEHKAEIHAEFAARVHRMELSEKDGNWPARPSGLCREWCPVGRKLCEHCGKD